MTQVEFESWREFYRQAPFDDFHRFHRPAALVATATVTKQRDKAIEESLAWLQPEANTSGWSEGELRSFRAHGIKPPHRKT